MDKTGHKFRGQDSDGNFQQHDEQDFHGIPLVKTEFDPDCGPAPDPGALGSGPRPRLRLLTVFSFARPSLTRLALRA